MKNKINKKIFYFFLPIFLGLVFGFVSKASVTTYYIDYDGGSDSNNGTSKDTPWKYAPGILIILPMAHILEAIL